MKTYITIAPLRLGSGLIELDRAQAASRAHAVEKTDTPDVYLIAKPIEFKVGEKIGYDGIIPKGQAEAVVLAESKADETCNAVTPAAEPVQDEAGSETACAEPVQDEPDVEKHKTRRQTK